MTKKVDQPYQSKEEISNFFYPWSESLISFRLHTTNDWNFIECLPDPLMCLRVKKKKINLGCIYLDHTSRRVKIRPNFTNFCGKMERSRSRVYFIIKIIHFYIWHLNFIKNNTKWPIIMKSSSTIKGRSLLILFYMYTVHTFSVSIKLRAKYSGTWNAIINWNTYIFSFYKTACQKQLDLKRNHKLKLGHNITIQVDRQIYQ